MSTRLFVKNLPKHVTEDKLKAFFSQKGQVTDVKILKKKYLEFVYSHNFSGVSRQIGFVGYKTEEEAKAAVSFFNNSYFNTSKLSVTFAEAVSSLRVVLCARREKSLLALGVDIQKVVLRIVGSIPMTRMRKQVPSLLRQPKMKIWMRKRKRKSMKNEKRKVEML